jgi:hypothetical protein
MPFGRKSMLGAALLAATTVPYAVTSSTQPKNASEPGAPPATATKAATAVDRVASPSAVPLPEIAGQASRGKPAAGLAGPPVRDLREIFRFDISPDWIVHRWSRVLTQTSEAEIRGYRVPLVTGRREQDLAGSLTYYFGPQQQVDRIVFHGTTGDARPLVALVTRQHGLQRHGSQDPGLLLYQRTSSGKVVDELRIRTAPVVRSDNRHARFTVDLLLRRPSSFQMLTQSRRAYSDRLGP